MAFLLKLAWDEEFTALNSPAWLTLFYNRTYTIFSIVFVGPVRRFMLIDLWFRPWAMVRGAWIKVWVGFLIELCLKALGIRGFFLSIKFWSMSLIGVWWRSGYGDKVALICSSLCLSDFYRGNCSTVLAFDDYCYRLYFIMLKSDMICSVFVLMNSSSFFESYEESYNSRFSPLMWIGSSNSVYIFAD